MRLIKVRDSDTNVVHIADVTNGEPLVCGQNPRRAMFAFLDDLAVGCPQCRTFLVDWLLGRGVSREVRHMIYDEIERQPCDCGNVPMHPRAAHGGSGVSWARGWGKGHGASEGDPAL